MVNFQFSEMRKNNKRQRTLLLTTHLLPLYQVSGEAPEAANGNIFKNV